MGARDDRSWVSEMPYLTLAVLGCALACLAWADLAPFMQWDRVGLARGEWWRLITGHLTHWNLNHAAWDLAMFGILGWLLERRQRGNFVVLIVSSAVIISVVMLVALPRMTQYRGLSGLDSALFACYCVSLLRQAWRRGSRTELALIAVFLSALMAKVIHEFTVGEMWFVDGCAAFVPIPLAHAVGVAVGTAVAILREANEERHRTPRDPGTGILDEVACERTSGQRDSPLQPSP